MGRRNHKIIVNYKYLHCSISNTRVTVEGIGVKVSDMGIPKSTRYFFSRRNKVSREATL